MKARLQVSFTRRHNPGLVRRVAKTVLVDVDPAKGGAEDLQKIALAAATALAEVAPYVKVRDFDGPATAMRGRE